MASDLEQATVPISSRRYDAFCSSLAPDGQDNQGDAMKLDRLTATYENQDDRFVITQRSYERQYAHLYFARLKLMDPCMRETIARHWPGIELINILDVGGRTKGPCCVFGTVAKEMKLRPTILDEYTKDRGLQSALAADNFVHESDTVALEDEGGRMALTGLASVLPVDQLVTGLVIAVRGENDPDDNDAFVVHEILYPGMPPQVPRPVLQEDKYVALVCGLKLSTGSQNEMKLQLAMDMLTGMMGSPDDQALAAKIVRLVVAGGSIGSSEALASTNAYGRQQNIALQPIKDMDMYLSELAAALPVDLMPGAEDPTNVAMPQQPLHRCLLPSASTQNALTRATNPHAFTVDGVTFVGTSGQPIEDVLKYSKHPDRLSVMRSCLEWRHLAPTAPDTLASYPFQGVDPFMLESAPHVMFAGCQPEFAATTVEGPAGQRVLLVAVPSFAKSSTLVLLNLRTLECQPYNFDCK